MLHLLFHEPPPPPMQTSYLEAPKKMSGHWSNGPAAASGVRPVVRLASPASIHLYSVLAFEMASERLLLGVEAEIEFAVTLTLLVVRSS